MFESLKRLARHSAVYGVGHIITRLLSFLLLPLYTNFFPRADMGVATIMFTYLAILTVIYTYGLDSALLRFYILEEDNKKKRRIFATAFYTTLATGIIFSGFLFLHAHDVAMFIFSSDSWSTGLPLASIVRYGAAILFFDALAILQFLIFRAEEKSGLFILFKFLNVACNITLNIIYVAHLKRGVEGVFFSNVLASGFTFITLAPFILRKLSFVYSKTDLRALLAFGLPYMPSTLSVVIMDTIDRPLLERLAGVEVAGLYGTGAKLAVVMALLIAAFRFAWHPFFLSVSKQPDAKQVFSKVLTYVMLACGVLYLFVSLFVDDIVRIGIGNFTLFGERYWESTVVVPIIMLAYVLNAMYVNFIIGIYLDKKTRYLPFITGAGMAVNLLVNFLLIPSLGMLGAAWARVAAYVVMAAALYFTNQRLYPIKYEFLRILKMAVIIASLFFIAKWITVPWDFLFRLVLFAAFPLLLWMSGFFQKAEIKKLRALLRSAGWHN